MNKRRATKSEAGSILVIVILIAVLLFSLTLLVGRDALSNMGSTSGTMDRKQARYAAFAGLQLALAKLNANTDEHWAAETPVTLPGTLPDNPDLSFEVQIRNNIYGNIDASIVPKGAVKLDSHSISAISGVTRRLSGLSGTAIQYNPSFDQAVLGSNITVSSNSKTIAFDFTLYTDRSKGIAMNATETAAVQDPTWKKGGKVVSNERLGVDSGGFIDGDVSYSEPPSTTTTPPGLPAAPTLTKGVHYSGDKVSSAGNVIPSARAPFDKAFATTNLSNFQGNPIYETRTGKDGKQTQVLVGYTPVPLAPGAYNNVTVPAGQTMQLQKGTYYFADTFSVSGSVILDPNAQVIIYVGKKMYVAGDVNFSGNPRDLQAYFTDEDNVIDPGSPPTPANISTLQVDAGKVTMVAAGAKLRAKLKKGRVLGALVADRAELNDSSAIEFDSNLAGQASLLKSEWKLTGIHDPSK